jgi:Flp pilus assembly pilin Flp
MQQVEQERVQLMTQLILRAFALLHSDEEGQAIVEYALILVLVSTAAFTILSAIGDYPSHVFSIINADF